jgi:hypothetical protein
MSGTSKRMDNYRIEVSGWGLNDVFFVEETELLWAEGGEKKLFLRHAPSEGAVIFIRLIAPETSCGAVPVTYRVDSVQPKNSMGLCEMRLARLYSRSRANKGSDVASPCEDFSSKGCGRKESSLEPEFEEVLHEA